MSSNTPNLGLLKKDPMVDGNETFNIKTMLNDNWDKIDEAVGEVREDLGNVVVPPASLTQAGIVQLSNETNGTRENVAPTEKALADVMKEALAGKQAGIDRKAEVVAALNSIGLTATTSETWSQLVPKMAAIIRATGNATAADLLAGKTASNANGSITGSMPNRGAGGTVTSGTTDIIKSAGYYSSNIIIKGDPNKKPENIKLGVIVDNVVGTLEPSVSGRVEKIEGNSNTEVSLVAGESYEFEMLRLPAKARLGAIQHRSYPQSNAIQLHTRQGELEFYIQLQNAAGTSTSNILYTSGPLFIREFYINRDTGRVTFFNNGNWIQQTISWGGAGDLYIRARVYARNVSGIFYKTIDMIGIWG